MLLFPSHKNIRYNSLFCSWSTNNPTPLYYFFLNKEGFFSFLQRGALTIRGPIKAFFLALLGTLRGVLIMLGPILTPFLNPAWQT